MGHGAAEDRGASHAVFGVAAPKRVVIVGGGAAGLALAVRLARTLGRAAVRVILVDQERTHLWKPLLHEAATGTLQPRRDFFSIQRLAAKRHFTFIEARMDGLDRARRELWVTAVGRFPGENPPADPIAYDVLVLALGAAPAVDAVPGAREHAFVLHSVNAAQQMQRALLLSCLRVQNEKSADASNGLAIVLTGGGTLGVELAAELRRASRALVAQGFDRLTPERGVRITLIEAESRVLPALPARVSEKIAQELARLRVVVRCGERVREVDAEGVITTTGEHVPATFTVWAAGWQAPDLLGSLAGLETNHRNQLVVGGDLQTTCDANIFAIGDCAAVPWADHREGVPPTARAAADEAAILAKTLLRRMRGESPLPFFYSEGTFSARLGHGPLWKLLDHRLPGLLALERWRAGLAYRVLGVRHRAALGGASLAMLAMLADFARFRFGHRLKVH